MDPMNKKALREKLAAFNSEEVKLACETLVWMDPERYIKELGKYVMMQKLDLEDIEFVINHRQSVKDRVTGEVMETEPMAFPEKIDEYKPVIFADKVDKKEGLKPEILSEEEIINTLDNINNKVINNSVDLKITEFLK